MKGLSSPFIINTEHKSNYIKNKHVNNISLNEENQDFDNKDINQKNNHNLNKDVKINSKINPAN